MSEPEDTMAWIDWYNALAKPSWTPAPATIGLIWQILYPVIAVTIGFVFVQWFRGKIGWKVAVLFRINLVANLIFTPIQFGMRNLPLASVDILVALGTIVWMMKAVWSHYRRVSLAQLVSAHHRQGAGRPGGCRRATDDRSLPV